MNCNGLLPSVKFAIVVVALVCLLLDPLASVLQGTLALLHLSASKGGGGG